MRIAEFFVLLALAACNLFSQEPARRLTFDFRTDASVNSLGSITRLNPAVGYNLSNHVSISGGLPLYVVHPSDASIANTGAVAANGIGDPYLQLRYTASTPVFGFASSLTGTAPVGDEARGFSTGHVTVDWTNYAEFPMGKLTPFGELGFANSSSDTRFFIRPYTSKGFITHVQGGARYDLLGPLSIAASLYAIEPSGSQTVTSRIKPQKTSTAGTTTTTTTGMGGSSMSAAGNGKAMQHVFETASVTTGAASIARDRGFSVWLRLSPAASLSLYGGVTRSTYLALNTVFIGAGISVGDLFHPKND